MLALCVHCVLSASHHLTIATAFDILIIPRNPRSKLTQSLLPFLPLPFPFVSSTTCSRSKLVGSPSRGILFPEAVLAPPGLASVGSFLGTPYAFVRFPCDTDGDLLEGEREEEDEEDGETSAPSGAYSTLSGGFWLVSALREMGSPSWEGLALGPLTFSAAIWRRGFLSWEDMTVVVV